MPNLQRRSIIANRFVERVGDTNLPIAVYDTDLQEGTPVVRLQNTVSENIIEIKFSDKEKETAVFVEEEFITAVSVDDLNSFDPIIHHLEKKYS